MGFYDFEAALKRLYCRQSGCFRTSLATVFICMLLSACHPVSQSPPQSVQISLGSAVVNTQSETLTPDDVRMVSDTSANSAYRLGANDIIAVTVYLHPDLSAPAPGVGGNVGGVLITSDGTAELPLIGNIMLGGMTLDQARQAITSAYASYVQDPKVAVQLVEAQSLSYYLLGAFTQPGVKYPVHQLTLLEALALGGSVDIPKADLYQAYVAQGSVKLPVDLYALLINGDLSQNILLASGDAIVIPSSETENAFVFGAVTKPGAVEFQSGGLSLLQALSVAGMDLPSYTDAQLSKIHIIRAHGRSAQFIIVDAKATMDGRALPFALEPGDIVFVPPTGVATWNQVLSEILPSLQTVSAALQPFVSIKYLAGKCNGC